MSLALNYCWKEWRAQRGLLTAYTLLVFSCLCLVLYLSPRHFWFEEGYGVHALSWFVVAGVIGVVGFVVPGLVRGEYTSKGEQFVRRLPGALWPSFWGKLLFLALAALTLPLLGLLVGELFVTSLDENWEGLFQWQWDGSVTMIIPGDMYACALALLLVPWVWAAGTWTPGGRLALLAALLLGLLIAVGVYAVERQSPQILPVQTLYGWLWAVPLAGLVVAALSWGLGRRGGGALRSARIGLLSTSVALAPFGVWLGDRAVHYHYPDCEQLAQLEVSGITSDGRYVLAHVSENESWYGVAVRLDLETGEAQQVGRVAMSWQPGILRPYVMSYHSQSRFWRVWRDDGKMDVFDLQTAEWTEVDYDAEGRELHLPDELRGAAIEDRIENTLFRDAEGRRIWVNGGVVCRQEADGSIMKTPWSRGDRHTIRAAGLALRSFTGPELFDFASNGPIAVKNGGQECMVGSYRVFKGPGSSNHWMVEPLGGEASRCEALKGYELLGLFDERRLLAYRRDCKAGRRLFLFAPDSGEVTDVELPADLLFSWVGIAAPMSRNGSMIERDPAGHVWLACHAQNDACFARIHPDTLQVSTVLPHKQSRSGRSMAMLSWREFPTVLMHDRLQIARINIETGERSVVFDGASGLPRADDSRGTAR